MGSINFKNVGQGDSIIIEWEFEGKDKIGIIDCAVYENRNPIIDHLSHKSISEIEFVVLSHFHYDHFSGMPELFNFCVENNIKINRFLHTLGEQVLQIYDRIFTSKKIEKATIDFFHFLKIADKYIINDFAVNFHTAPFNLTNSISMSFLSPAEKTGRNIAKQINRKVNVKEFTYDDLNKFSTIIQIQNSDRSILLTSDSVKGCYRNLNNYIYKKVILVQAPHHGSIKNIYPNFWTELKRIDNCPVVFSVGYEPKDKLPNKETIEFFDKSGFNVFSTNPTFGISEYFGFSSPINIAIRNKTQLLNHFSKKINTIKRTSTINTKYEGDQVFTF